jgi:NAD(P)-dependent dehydrogenase (short-subunit alcohol dehydrogenase family)
MTTTKNVLVTGANRGIGRAIAKQFATHGYEVIVAARQHAAAQAVVAEIQATGGKARAIEMDVGDVKSIHAAAAALNASGFALHALVNNAGVNQGFADTILTASSQDIDQSLRINGFGPLEVTKAFLPALKAAGSAHVINVSSEAGSIAETVNPDSPYAFMEGASYRLSKNMTNGVTGLLAKALRKDGIKVNAMCPGWTQTDMGGAEAPNKPEVGAALAFQLANGEQTGGFFNTGGRLAW